jgi:hypothetical protein
MRCGWGCGEQLTATGIRSHFTRCPRRPKEPSDLERLEGWRLAFLYCRRCVSGTCQKCTRRVRVEMSRKDPTIKLIGRPRGAQMPCGWDCGAVLTGHQMREHFTGCAHRPEASAKRSAGPSRAHARDCAPPPIRDTRTALEEKTTTQGKADTGLEPCVAGNPAADRSPTPSTKFRGESKRRVQAEAVVDKELLPEESASDEAKLLMDAARGNEPSTVREVCEWPGTPTHPKTAPVFPIPTITKPELPAVPESAAADAVPVPLASAGTPPSPALPGNRIELTGFGSWRDRVLRQSMNHRNPSLNPALPASAAADAVPVSLASAGAPPIFAPPGNQMELTGFGSWRDRVRRHSMNHRNFSG